MAKPTVSLLLLHDHEGRLLLIRRADSGLYSLPGGHLDPGEDPEVGAQRELLEETGLRCDHLTEVHGLKPNGPEGPVLAVFSGVASGYVHNHLDPDLEGEPAFWPVADGLPAEVYDHLHGPQDDTNVVRQLYRRAEGPVGEPLGKAESVLDHPDPEQRHKSVLVANLEPHEVARAILDDNREVSAAALTRPDVTSEVLRMVCTARAGRDGFYPSHQVDHALKHPNAHVGHRQMAEETAQRVYAEGARRTELEKSTPEGIRTLNILRARYKQNAQDFEQNKLPDYEKQLKAYEDSENSNFLLPSEGQRRRKLIDKAHTAPVAVNLPGHVLSSVTAVGRLLNQFETGTSQGTLDPEPGGDRESWEKNHLGIDRLTHYSKRPIYGHLHIHHDDPHRGPQGSISYGDAMLTLHPHVRERTTFTPKDSSSIGSHEVFLNEHAHHAVMQHEMDRNGDYVEAQIHGGVDMAKDVAALHLVDCGVKKNKEDALEFGKKFQVPVYLHKWKPGTEWGRGSYETTTLHDPTAAPAPEAKEPKAPEEPHQPEMTKSEPIPDLSEMKHAGSAMHLGGTGEKHLYDHPTGQYVVKPAVAKDGSGDKPFAAHVQQAFAHVASQVRGDQHLPVASRDLGGQQVAVMPLLDLHPQANLGGYSRRTPSASLTPQEHADVAAEHVLDWMFSQHDSHGENLIRTKEGRVLGCDKEQAFRYLGRDKLDTNYHPNGVYGQDEPYYNTFWRDWSAGHFNYDPRQMEPHIAAAESIPDDHYRETLQPYAQSLFPHAPARAEELLSRAVARKNSLRSDFEGFLSSLYARRTGEQGRFTFQHGWQGSLGKAEPKTLGDVGQTEHTERGVHFKTGQPVTFQYQRHVGKAPRPIRVTEDSFQQTLEPHGRYMSHHSGVDNVPGVESGTATFQNPLVLAFNTSGQTSYDGTSWKARLSGATKARGAALSRKLAAMGHDGVVTVGHHHQGPYISEIVDLTMFHKSESYDHLPVLVKTHPTPTFPGMGIDNRRETPIVDSQQELKSKRMAIDVHGYRMGAPRGLEGLGERPSAGAVSVAPGAHTGYALSNKLRDEAGLTSGHPMNANIHKHPNAPVATQLHEDFHQVMNRVREKYGPAGAYAVGKHLVDSLPAAERRHVQEWGRIRNGLREDHPYFPEEGIASLHNYLNNPAERDGYHAYREDSPEQRRIISSAMKRAHKRIRAHAAQLTHEDATELTRKQLEGQKLYEQYARFGKTEDLAKRAKKEKAPAAPTLVAVHNLSAGNLAHAHQLGGLAAPSIAIKHKDHDFHSFGDISLVAHKDMVDPERGVPSFDADVYSPRHPKSEYDVPEKPLREFRTWLKPHAEKTSGGYTGDLEDTVRKEGHERLSEPRSRMRPALVTAWLHEVHGEAVEPIRREVKLNGRYEWMKQPAFQAFTAKYPHGVDDMHNYEDGEFERWHPEASKAAKEAIEQYAQQTSAALNGGTADPLDTDEYRNRLNEALFDEDGLLHGQALQGMGQAYRRLRDAGTAGEIDQYATEHAVEDRVKELGEDKFQAWAKTKTAPLQGKPYLPKHIDSYAGPRMRRIPYTLDNIMREMKRTVRQGENFNYGLGSARAAGAKKFRSLDQMKDAAGKLMPHDQFKVHKDALDDKFGVLAENLRSYHSDPGGFRVLDSLAGAIGDSYKRGRYIGRELRENGFNNVPPHLQNDARAFAQELINAPTEYFEAKPQRVVDLTEFKGAVVPHDVSDETLGILRDNYINHIERYNRDDEASRTAAINRIAEAQKLHLSEDVWTGLEAMTKALNDAQAQLHEACAEPPLADVVNDRGAAKLLAHHDPRERLMAVLTGKLTPREHLRAILDDDHEVHTAALARPDVTPYLLRLVAAARRSRSGAYPLHQVAAALYHQHAGPDHAELAGEAAHHAGAFNDNDLAKGSRQAKLPFNPDKVDVGDEQAIGLWQGQNREGPETREQVPRMTGHERTRAIMRLAAATPTRRGPNGELQFLLHRGMGRAEHAAATATPGVVTHNDSMSSWTPEHTTARNWGEDYAYKDHPRAQTKEQVKEIAAKGKVASAWISASHIHSIPRQYGALNHRADGGQTKIRGGNDFWPEHEVIVSPHSSPVASRKDIEQRTATYGSLDNMINARNGGISARHQLRGGYMRARMQGGYHNDDE